MTHPRPRRIVTAQFAFTLVELLVVIGIISVLIGILLPALTAARRAGNSVKCESNLRQVGLSLQMYAQQFDGHYPASYIYPQDYSIVTPGIDGGSLSGTGFNVYWYQRLQIMGFLPGASDPSKSPLVCPSQLTPFQPFQYNAGEFSLFNNSYGLNQYMSIQDGSNGPIDGIDDLNPNAPRLTQYPKVLNVPNSSDKLVAADILNGYIFDPYSPNTPTASNGASWDWRRHVSQNVKYGSCNVLFLDGHVTNVIQGIDSYSRSSDVNGLYYPRGLYQQMPY